MIIISKKFRFDSAHRLWVHTWTDDENLAAFGKCTRLHGHTYELAVFVEGPISPTTGMVLNYADLTKIVKPVVDRLDHQNLNDVFNHLTTAEMMVQTIANWISDAMMQLTFVPTEAELVEVDLSETPKTQAVWTAG